jgi:myo-inositol-1(or 4)-monophosphatase
MKLSDEILISIDEIAQRAAGAARDAILPFFRSFDLVQDNKAHSGFDPVTQADRAAEARIREIVRQARPHDSILGEEFDDYTGTSGLTWVLDPIDGTRGFISGTPTWGVLIAVSNANGPFYGLIDQPYIGERFIGSPLGARMSGPHSSGNLVTRGTRDLSDATIFTTFPEVGSEADARAFRAVADQAKLTRYGMDCYAYALLAAGQIDLVIEAGLQAYDIQAPIAVIEAAGGVVTDWEGGPAHHGGRVLAAANRDIHAKALKILKGMSR